MLGNRTQACGQLLIFPSQTLFGFQTPSFMRKPKHNKTSATVMNERANSYSYGQWRGETSQQAMDLSHFTRSARPGILSLGPYDLFRPFGQFHGRPDYRTLYRIIVQCFRSTQKPDRTR